MKIRSAGLCLERHDGVGTTIDRRVLKCQTHRVEYDVTRSRMDANGDC